MDKKKTGTLIREARIRKKYTQSELGDLLGVTNKAVSRWENGDSFPDIGVLENLSNILNVKIQDIVIGEISDDRTDSEKDSVITDFVRIVKLQEKSNKKKVCYYFGGTCMLLYSLFLALAGIGLRFAPSGVVEGGIFYIISLTVILGVTLWATWSMRKNKSAISGKNRISGWVFWIAVVTYLYEILAAGIIVMKTANGTLVLDENKLFNAQSLGWFLNMQLCAVFFVNFAMTVMEFIRIAKENTDVHRGLFFSIPAMYIAMLYSDMLYRMCTPQEVLQIYFTRTAAIIVLTVCAEFVFYGLKRKALNEDS